MYRIDSRGSYLLSLSLVCHMFVSSCQFVSLTVIVSMFAASQMSQSSPQLATATNQPITASGESMNMSPDGVSCCRCSRISQIFHQHCYADLLLYLFGSINEVDDSADLLGRFSSTPVMLSRAQKLVQFFQMFVISLARYLVGVSQGGLRL